MYFGIFLSRAFFILISTSLSTTKLFFGWRSAFSETFCQTGIHIPILCGNVLTLLLSWWTVPLSPAAQAQGSCPQPAVERFLPSCRRSRYGVNVDRYFVILKFNNVNFPLKYLNSVNDRQNLLSHTCVEVVILWFVFRFRLKIGPPENTNKCDSIHQFNNII